MRNRYRLTTRRAFPGQSLEQRVCLASGADLAPPQIEAVVGFNESTGQWEFAGIDSPDSLISQPVAQWQEPLLADTDGDGIQEVWMHDLATGDWWQINVLPGGSSSEAVKGNWNVAAGLKAIAAVDLTGDGRDDIIGFNPVSGKWIALTKDSGSYQNLTLSSWTPDGSWSEPLAGDANGDGVAEIYIRSTVHGSWWQLSKSDSTFRTTYLGSWSPTIVVDRVWLADFDGDGTKELLGLSGNQAIVSWLSGGSNTFYLPATASNAVVGDLNGDQRAEVIAHDTLDGYWRAWQVTPGVITSQIVGHWNPQYTYSDIHLVNVTGDGTADIVGRSEGGDWWSLSHDPAQPGNTFLMGWSPAAGWDSIRIADVDRDGRADILGRQRSDDTWVVIRHNGSGVAGDTLRPLVPAGGSFSVSAVTGNLTGGSAESLLTWDAYQGKLIVRTLSGSAWETSIVSLKAYRADFEEVFRFDADGDGNAEPVGWDQQTGSLWRLAAAGGRLQHEFLLQLSGGEASTRLIADLDGDGDLDLISFDPETARWEAALVAAYAPPKRVLLAAWNTDQQFRNPLLADLQGDGVLDLLALDQQDGLRMTLREEGQSRDELFAGWESLAEDQMFVADFDDDGRDEIASRNQMTGDWHMLQLDDGGLSSSKVGNWSLSAQYRQVHLADISGSGQPEIVGQDASGSWWAAVYNGTRFANQRIGYWEPGRYYTYAGTADLDGDGKVEIVGVDPAYARAIAFNAHGVTSLSVAASAARSVRWASGLVVESCFADGQELFGQAEENGDWYRYRLVGQTLVEELAAEASGTWTSAAFVSAADVSNAALRSSLLAEIEGLEAALAAEEPVAAIRLLLAWSAEAVNFSLSSPISNATTALAQKLSAGELYYRYLTSNQGAYYCLGTAHFLADLLALFDIPAMEVDFGRLQSNLTHTTLVAPLIQDGETRYVLFDPTFHVEFRLGDSDAPAGLLEMLDAYQQGNADSIGVVQRTKDAMDWVIESTQSLPAESAHEFVYVATHGDRSVYHRPGFGLQKYLDTVAPHLTLAGLPTGVPGFVALVNQRVIRIVPNAVSNHAADLTEQLNARGVPVGL